MLVNDVGLGKNTASAGYMYRFMRPDCEIAEIIDRKVQAMNLLLEKTAGAGRTDGVLEEISKNRPVKWRPPRKPNEFSVFAANLENGVRLGQNGQRAQLG